MHPEKAKGVRVQKQNGEEEQQNQKKETKRKKKKDKWKRKIKQERSQWCCCDFAWVEWDPVDGRKGECKQGSGACFDFALYLILYFLHCYCY